MRTFLSNLYGREGRRWVLAGLLAACVLLFAAVFCSVSFYDNDDLNIAWALAGYRSGAPSFSHPFLNCITGAAVSGLYTLFPAAPWWFLLQWAALWAGMTALFAAAFTIGFRIGAPFLVPLIACGLLGAGVCLYPVVAVTFTLTSALLGAGAAALVLAYDPAEGKKQGRGYLTGSVALLMASLLIRQSSGLCVFCFYLGALCWRLINGLLKKNEPVKRLLTTAVVALAAVALLTIVNAWGRDKLNPDGFMEFENARAEYMDYPHDTYAENPALYESAGWDGTLAALADRWFYMDERISADAMGAISEGSEAARLATGEKLIRGWETMTVFLGKYLHARLLLSFAAALLLGLIACRIGGKTGPLSPALAGTVLTLGAALLLGYLCVQGRMNLRTFQTVLFPLTGCLTLLILSSYRKKRLVNALLLLCGLLALLPAQKSFREVWHIDCAEQIALSRQVTGYALAHPGNVYIRDVYAANNFDALCVYPEEKPVNLMDWGGCDMYTAAREGQLGANGLAGPYADAFLQDNVYYVCEKDGEYLPLLAKYMAETWGAAGYEIADGIGDGIVAVKFLPGA